jgi:hypothetical protein
MQSDQRRMSTALLIAVLFHALLLSITFGGQTFGLPGFKLPWKERRLNANDLQVMLAPSPPRPESLAQEVSTCIGRRANHDGQASPCKPADSPCRTTVPDTPQ